VFVAFPLNNKPNWRNPPWATILLIVVNCLIYFGPQGSEQSAWNAAAAFYAKSDLPGIELPRYAEYLAQREPRAAARLKRATAAGAIVYALRWMDNDAEFQARLHADLVVRASEEQYPAWHEQRARFEALKGPSFTRRWASNPADWQPISLITAAFLHGSTAHLIGNMVFLFAFGYTVEMTLGRWRYLLFYLLAGTAGELGDLIARWGSPVIGLGASGAISGLMAMYAMLYGRRRIRFFYQVLFYFDYVKAPAIILLPIWIGHEFLQQWLNPEGGIAYMAHAGGLIGGALLTAAYLHRHPNARVPVADEPTSDAYAEQLAAADEQVKSMRLDQARASYAALWRERPHDHEVLKKYFNLAHLTRAGDDLHAAAHGIFAIDRSNTATDTWLHETFRTYWAAAQPRPQLSADEMARLSIRFARLGQIGDAERLLRLLFAAGPAHMSLPAALLGLVRAELARNGRERATQFAAELGQHFPGAAEARIAADLLAASGNSSA
jgi:membrane associated rhomboid family serine protease